MGLYEMRRGLSFSDEVSRIVASVGFNVLVIISAFYFLRVEHVSRFLLLYYAVSDVLVVSIVRELVRSMLGRIRARGNNIRSVMIVGTGEASRRVSDIINKQRILGLKIIGYVVSLDEDGEIMGDMPSGEILGSMEELESLLETHRPDMVMYTLADQNNAHLTSLLDLCDQAGINLKIVPSFAGLIAVKGDVENLEGIPFISIREVPARTGINRLLKRSFDIVFSLTVICILSPLFILTALAVKLGSRGPVFYKQERVGLDNRPFGMLKFRTMKVQQKKDSDTLWTTKNDPRVTAVGRIIRKLSIDELPQFFNVLAGNMSVVGPRPERPYFVQQFKGKYHHYMRRHAVKAGITGWAQVNGLRGDTSIQERIEADIFYIENWSFWLDLKIIVMTPFKGMFNENAY